MRVQSPTGAVPLCCAALVLAGCASQPQPPGPFAGGARAPRVELETTPFFPQQRYQCGPAALATVLVASGAETGPDALVSQVYLPGRQGSVQPEMIAATRRHDRLPYVLPPSLDALLATVEGGTPVLVLQKLGAGPWPGWHYAVVVGHDAGRERVVLRSGTTRRKEMTTRHFLATWDRADRWAMAAVVPGDLPPVADFAHYMEAAAGLEAVGRGDAAARAYDAAVNQWPGQPLPRLALGNLAYARGDQAEAEQAFRAAARLAPQDAAARNNRAEVLRQMGCHGLARREVELARSLAEGGPLAPTVAETARKIAAEHGPDAAGCPTD